MEHEDKEKGARSAGGQKRAKRTKALAGALLVLALFLSVVLVMMRKEAPEKERATKVIKEIPRVAEKLRLKVPPPPEPEIEPWPAEGPLPHLGYPEAPVAVLPTPPVEKPPSVPEVSAVAKGRLYVNPEPEGAVIQILNIKPTYHRGMTLEAGSYHILVSHPGYDSQKRWVQVEAEKDNTFVFTLDRIVTTGAVLVKSSPPGAQWFLDGNPAGITPGGKEAVEQGDHLVVVKMAGYEEWGKTVSVKAKEKTFVDAVLAELGPRPGQVWREPMTGMVFVWIPEGCFNMGSPAAEAGRDLDEGPVHEVCLDGFWMGKTEITNGQYRQFNPAHDSKAVNGQSLNEENQPAVHVSWSDAKSFSQWLTEKNAGPFSFRLPTEAEWEYACRARSRSVRFWGDHPDEACQFANVYDGTSKGVHDFQWVHHDCDDGYAVTAPVGSFRRNPFGLYDMLGNVWEWCEDTYGADAYKSHPKDNPIHTGRGPFQVNRGGSWSDIPRSVRCAVRERLDPEFGNFYVGFRLVRTP